MDHREKLLELLAERIAHAQKSQRRPGVNTIILVALLSCSTIAIATLVAQNENIRGQLSQTQAELNHRASHDQYTSPATSNQPAAVGCVWLTQTIDGRITCPPPPAKDNKWLAL